MFVMHSPEMATRVRTSRSLILANVEPRKCQERCGKLFLRAGKTSLVSRCRCLSRTVKRIHHSVIYLSVLFIINFVLKIHTFGLATLSSADSWGPSRRLFALFDASCPIVGSFRVFRERRSLPSVCLLPSGRS